MRREDRGLGKVHGARIGALAHHASRAIDAGDRPIGVPRHRVPFGHVEAVLLLERIDAEARAAVPEPRLHDLRNEDLALADRDHVREWGQGLRVQEGGGAADEDERVAPSAILGTERNPGHPQHLDDVEVVVLEGNREGDHVEVAKRRARLEARERPDGASLLFFGEEGALAHDLRKGVEVRVDALEAEIRHSDVIEIRIGKDDPQRTVGLARPQVDLGVEPGGPKVVGRQSGRLDQARRL